MSFKSIEDRLNDCMLSSDEIADVDDQYFTKIEKAVKHQEETLEIDGIEGLKRTLHDDAEKWKTIPINIGVIGNAGVGKSSFINAFLGMKCKDPGAAKVGEKETTTIIQLFENPNRPSLKLWDMPGVGTSNYEQNGYLKKVKFGRYDFFLILSCKRFTAYDLWLATEIQKQQKRFYFVRTFIDMDIYNNWRRDPDNHDEDTVKNEIKEDCKENLKRGKIDNPIVFLVDNYDRTKFEFQDLENKLLSECDDLKFEAMTLSLSNLTKNVREKKMQTLKDRSISKAMEIACAFNDREMQMKLFNEEIRFYAEQFNIDEKEVLNNKKLFQISDEVIQKFQEIFEDISTESVAKLPRMSVLKRTYLACKKLFERKEFPVHSQTTLNFCIFALQLNLDVMYNMAKDLYSFDGHRTFLQSSLKRK